MDLMDPNTCYTCGHTNDFSTQPPQYCVTRRCLSHFGLLLFIFSAVIINLLDSAQKLRQDPLIIQTDSCFPLELPHLAPGTIYPFNKTWSSCGLA